jgi:hydroxymethylbilane synthase
MRFVMRGGTMASVPRTKLTIATRGSALALWQAEHTKARLRANEPGLEVELLTLKTQGDLILDVPLSQVGGKALFVKEIEAALLDGRADIAVHSMKDVPADLAPGLVLAATSTREVPNDALCVAAANPWKTIDDLPRGARIGTSSLRRQCQLLARRPDLIVRMLRGNVPTRLRKLDEGEHDAIILAAAGLVRLGHGERITQLIPIDVSLPAVSQGVLGIETRGDDEETHARVVAAMHDAQEERRVAAERAFLKRMGGSCQTPLAAHATFDPDQAGGMFVDALCGMPDGSKILRARTQGTTADAEGLGIEAAELLLAQGADAIVAACNG